MYVYCKKLITKSSLVKKWLLIYIYKEEGLSVCVFAMHSHTVQPISMKLSRNDLYTQGEVDIYLVRKKNEPYPCYRQSMKLTNRIPAFEKVTGRGSEGGRRPSERSYTSPNMFCLPMATRCLLRATWETDQWDWSILRCMRKCGEKTLG